MSPTETTSLTDSGRMLDENWQSWVRHNLDAGCNPLEVRDILFKNNFAPDTVKRVMGDRFPGMENTANVIPKPPYRLKPENYQRLTEVALTQQTIPNIRRVDTQAAQLYAIEHFLTDEECDGLVAISRTKLQPSEISHDNGDKYFRTSSTCNLHAIDDELIQHVDWKIAHALGIHLTYSEEIQAQLYLPGQEFKTHSDYFEPYTPYYDQFATHRGNRTWTFMIYLNTTPQGGGTRFPEIGVEFMPKKGSALVWNNLLADGAVNPKTMHAGLPVEEGEKIIITKWFREKGMGPMFQS